MSQKPKAVKRPRQQTALVIAGEDGNDRQVLCELIRESCPRLTANLLEIRDPVRLKTATGPNLTIRVRTLVNKARARAIRDDAVLAGILVHEDLDAAAAGSYAAVRAAISGELARQSDCATALALAAWETEAWLLLFPAAFTELHKGWKVPAALCGKDTGRLSNPKELLQSKIGAPKYRESDAPALIRSARKLGLVGKPAGSNTSYADFVADLAQWA